MDRPMTSGAQDSMDLPARNNRLPPGAPSRSGVRRLAAEALGILFPPVCAGCDTHCASGEQVCVACREAIDWICDGVHCPRCGVPYMSPEAHPIVCGNCRITAPPFDIARAATKHASPMTRVIHAYKYGRRRNLALTLGACMWHGVRDLFEGGAWDTLIPVPLHPSRLRWRGFDQAVVLAHELEKYTGLPVAPRLLRRIRNTPQQTHMSETQRRANVRGAFQCSAVTPETPKPLRGRRVILVDDVYTTGATLWECSTVLTRAGADAVGVVTITRAGVY